MAPGWLVIVALVVGLGVGVGVTAMLFVAAHRNRAAAAVTAGSLPSGIDAVLDVLEAPAILVDPSNQLVKASHSAESAGLADGIAHPVVLAAVAEVRRTGEPLERDVTIERRRDQPRHLHLSAALVGARHVLVLADDRTEAVRLEEVRRDFVANVSHELKTPIGAVSLLAEAVESAADDPAQVRRFAARLSAEAARLSNLTQDIIALSRVQGAVLVEEPELVGIDGVIAAAIDNNRVAAEAKHIEIVSGGARGIVVLGHEPTLVTALHNLIANALQYSPDRSRVGVGVTRRDGNAEIAVTDQGPGISEEDQERIFERFFRSDPARSRNTGGTGLGLAIVKHTVANHGGEIRVWSRPGQGSTFTVSLPIAGAPEPAVPKSAPEPAAPKSAPAAPPTTTAPTGVSAP